MLNKEFDNLTTAELEKYIGRRVKKISENEKQPHAFKSGRKINTVKGVIEHPYLKVPAFTFKEDESYVAVRGCVLCSDDEVEVIKPPVQIHFPQTDGLQQQSFMDMDKLNTATKYPSILTYHELGERGKLNESLSEGKTFEGEYVITEKIDGTNGRVIFCLDDYLIGSREDLLYAKGDRIGNPNMNIVEVLKPVAEQLVIDRHKLPGFLITFYFEVYGGNINKTGKQYTGAAKKMGCRLFDITFIPPDEIEALFKKDIEQISSWREHGGQTFFTEDMLHDYARELSLKVIPRLPFSEVNKFPITRKNTYEFLKQFSKTQASLDGEGTGKSEGIVVRTPDRKLICKIRFEDYERTHQAEGF